MRNVLNLAVGDVITASELSDNEYFLVVDLSPDTGYFHLVSLGEDRFRDVVLGRQKRLFFRNIGQLGKVRRHARYVKRVTFSRH